MLSTVERTVHVMTALSLQPEGLTLSELARHIGSNKQAVFRISKTLASFHLVATDPRTGRLRLGAGLLRLADTIRPDLDLRQIALPALMELRDATGETACLHVTFGTERMCIAQVESRDELRWVAEIGKPFPLTGAPGKTFLAYLPEPGRARRSAGSGTAAGKSAGQTPLARELQKVRNDGYAVARDETIPGVSSVSAPVRDSSKAVIAAVTILGPSSRLSRDTQSQHARSVVAAATRISALLGGTAVHPSVSAALARKSRVRPSAHADAPHRQKRT
jgi:IclR family acetate operon transcriptional repressor